MSRRNSSAGNLGRSRFASFRPCLQVLKPRTLLSFISWKSLGAALVFSGVVFCALSFWPRVEASFITAPTYATGSRPVSVAVGDFNGDGKPDLAVANMESGTVSVLLGNGDGTFQAAQSYRAGSNPVSVVVGDFNGDGQLDLAVVNQTDRGTVSVLLGNGDGTFQASQNNAVGSFPDAMAVGDFDGDGTLDLVVANGNSNSVSVLLSNGDGTFLAAQSYAAGGHPRAVTIGDFNGDGHLDLAVADTTLERSVSVLLGNGDGTFQAARRYAPGFYPSSMAIGDFNEDGILDLVVTSGQNAVAVLLGKGDGTFQHALSQRYAAGTGNRAVAVGDFNGDGHLDLAVSNAGGDSTVIVFLGNGDGTFQGGAISYAVDPYSVPVAQGTSDGHAVAVGDFNGDGHPDLAVAVSSGLSILLGRGDGTFRSAPVNYPTGSLSFPYPSTSSVVVADFNGDGILDLAMANITNPTVSVYLGKGDGTFQAAQNYAAGGSPVFVAVGDFNGDRIPDLAVANSDDRTVSILLGNRDGTFQAPRSDTQVGKTPNSIAVGDFNGDGIPDLAVANRDSNTVSVLLGNGDGTFQVRTDYAVDSFPFSVAVGDFNGDGHQDLVVVGGWNAGITMVPPSTMSILLGNGDGTFQAAHIYDAGLGGNSVAVGDFNGDGKQDIVTTNFAWTGNPPRRQIQVLENDVRVYLGNGDGTFQAAVTYSVDGGRPVYVAVGDFNGDGVPDLAVADGGTRIITTEGTHTVSVLLGRGDGTFRPALSYGPGGFPTSVAVGDFNGDGLPDLAVGVVDGVSVLLNADDWGR